MKRKLNFRIVEGKKIDVDFEQLKKDYLNKDMYVEDILKKHDISLREYHRLKKRLAEETGVPYKKTNTPTDTTKYIFHSTSDNVYKVSKWIDDKAVHFGSYKSLEDAIKARDMLIAHNWDWGFYIDNICPHTPSKPLDEIYEDMDSFKFDFLDGMSVESLIKKYDITLSQYQKLSKRIKQEYGLKRKPRGFPS